MAAQRRLAEEAGARAATQWEAERLERVGARWQVISAAGERVTASWVVVAAGGWFWPVLEHTELPSRFRGRVPRPVVTQETAVHFPYRDGVDDHPGTVWQTSESLTYSLPGGRDAEFRGQKAAEFGRGVPVRDAAARTGQVDEDARARLIEHARRCLHPVVPEPYAETTCLFTTLPHEDFLLDVEEGLVLASPCSGHGAKFAPLIGERIAGVVDGEPTEPRWAVGSTAGGSGVSGDAG